MKRLSLFANGCILLRSNTNENAMVGMVDLTAEGEEFALDAAAAGLLSFLWRCCCAFLTKFCFWSNAVSLRSGDFDCG